jgi:hypothetical protein
MSASPYAESLAINAVLHSEDYPNLCVFAHSYTHHNHRLKRTINLLETNSEAIVAASSRLCALIAALIVLPSPSFHNSIRQAVH